MNAAGQIKMADGTKWLGAAYRIAGAIVLTALIVWAAHSGSGLRAARPNRILTAQQIAARAQTICRLLSGFDGQLQQTTEQAERVDTDGRRHVIYAVDCENDSGQHGVHTLWDAETGRLIQATHQPRHSAADPAIPANNPADVAWRWLQRLDVASWSSRWKVPTPPIRDGDNSVIKLVSEKYCATVVVNRYTDDLVYITIKAEDRAGSRH